MHNISLGKTVIPTVEETVGILTRHTEEFGIPLDYDRILEYRAYYLLKGHEAKRKLVRSIGFTGSIDNFKPDIFKAFLKQSNVSVGLIYTKKGDISLGEDSLEAAIATGIYSAELVEIMRLYLDMGRSFKIVSSFEQMFQFGTISKTETFDNHRMLIVRPRWVPQNTGRLGAQDPGIMNLSNKVHDIFTVPKGYIYREVDSGQIEPRIIQSAFLKDPQLMKCTMLYDDAYYGYIHYCRFLDDVTRASGTLDIKPIEITDEMVALRKKFKTFGNATMYGSTENVLNDPDKAAFIKYIGGHPKRLEWVKQIEHQLDRGQIMFNTAFGVPIDITKNVDGEKYDTETKKRHALIKRAINNPIQGTGADLMRYSVKQADKLLKTKAPKSHILQYVHDAGKFAIHEDEYDLIKNEIEEITAYQVDDWIPIHSGVTGFEAGQLKRFIV